MKKFNPNEVQILDKGKSIARSSDYVSLLQKKIEKQEKLITILQDQTAEQ